MFDLFGTSVEREQFVEYGRVVAIELSAIWQLLVEKGIVTEEEIEQTRLRLTAPVEQALEAAKEERQRQWREDNPEEAKMFDFFNKILGGKDA